MTAPEPPAEPEPRPISEIIDQLLAMNAELDRKEGLERGGGPAGRSYFVLEVRGVPQSVSGPYQAEPELGRDYDGPELHPGTAEYEAEYDEYQAWAEQTDPYPLADPDPEVGGWPGWSDRSMLAPDPAPDPEPEAEAEAESGPELEP